MLYPIGALWVERDLRLNIVRLDPHARVLRNPLE